MNREIKFQIWDKKNQEMISNMQNFKFIESINSRTFLRLGVNENNNFTVCAEHTDDYEILQYTGEVVPSTGEMIFEGDILEQSYLSPLNNKRIVKRYLICFEDACYKAKLIGHSPYGDTHLYFVIANSKTFDTKIIGDAYRNPELLEVQQ
nr:MAG TPA: YopX protein [Caudoviricetes sp.]